MLAAALRIAGDVIAREYGLVHEDEVRGGYDMMLAVLWSRVLKFDAADPDWPDQDRFVLSAGSAMPLLLAALRLTGHDGMPPDATAHDRRPSESLAARCDRGSAVGLTAAAGGQAVAGAVGMALTERVLATRFGKSLVDHRVWAVARASELAHGVTHEAISFAGQMRLDRLALLVEASDADSTDDARARFTSCGWVVKAADSRDAVEIEAALSFAQRSRKPTLIWCTKGSSTARTVQPASSESWRALGSRGSVDRRGWLKRIARHMQRPDFERVTAARLPDGWHESFDAVKQQLKLTSATASPAQTGLQLVERLAATIPELLCARSGMPAPDASLAILPGRYAGRAVDFGARPLGMLACLNGIAAHGGLLPIAVSTWDEIAFQVPALRQAATLRRRLIHLAIGPSAARAAADVAQPDLCGLDRLAQLHVFRPGCAVETAECMELALRRGDGPSLLLLSDDAIASLRVPETGENRCARGGYVLAAAEPTRQVTLVAEGSDILAATRARAALALRGIGAALVSLPCRALFASQSPDYQRATFGEAPRIAIGSAPSLGLSLLTGSDVLYLDGDDLDAASITRKVQAVL